MTLNVEEMILLQQTGRSTRNAALQELTDNTKLTQDAELLGLYSQLINKLRAMSEQEFAAIDLTVYDDENSVYGGENETYEGDADGK